VDTARALSRCLETRPNGPDEADTADTKGSSSDSIAIRYVLSAAAYTRAVSSTSHRAALQRPGALVQPGRTWLKRLVLRSLANA
jgi:hypothetical protein